MRKRSGTKSVLSPRAVVGTVDLGLKGIPYISVENLVTGIWHGKPGTDIIWKNVRHEKEVMRMDHDAVMETAFGKSIIHFLDPEKKMSSCTDISMRRS